MIKHFICASNVVPEKKILKNPVDCGVLATEQQDNAEKSSTTSDPKDTTNTMKPKPNIRSHCTNCPYSVWVWLTEFQRRLLERKEVDESESSNNNNVKHRVKYGARKIFYSRVWNRLNGYKATNGEPWASRQDCFTETSYDTGDSYGIVDEDFPKNSKKRKMGGFDLGTPSSKESQPKETSISSYSAEQSEDIYGFDHDGASLYSKQLDARADPLSETKVISGTDV
jgi:hypothetical protein